MQLGSARAKDRLAIEFKALQPFHWNVREYEGFTSAEAALSICCLQGFNHCLPVEQLPWNDTCSLLTKCSVALLRDTKSSQNITQRLNSHWFQQGQHGNHYCLLSRANGCLCCSEFILYWSSKYFLPLVILKGLSGAVNSLCSAGW